MDENEDIEDVDVSSGGQDEEGEDLDKLRSVGWTDELMEAHGITVESVKPSPATPEPEPVAEEVAPPVNPDIDIEALKQEAEFGRQWQEAFVRDPQNAVLTILNSPAFSNEAKAAIVASLSTQLPQEQGGTAFDVSAYEPQSDLEKVLLPAYDWVTRGEQVVAEALAQRDEDVRLTYAYASALEAKLSAIEALLDTKLPDFDSKAAFSLFAQNTNVSLNDAVKQTYGKTLEEFVKIEKQKKAPRPSTPRNQGVAPAHSAKVENMMDAWKLAGAMLGED